MGRDARPALVVDDDPEAREVLRNFLGLCGLSVLEAQNGLEALLSVKRHGPGTVVLDLNMPRLGGLETLKRIRTFDPTIRVAVVTENPAPSVHQQARALGAIVVLIKPVDLAQLGTALDLTPADPQPIAPVPASAPRLPAAPPEPSTARILVVDDDARRRDHAPKSAAALSTPLRVDGADGKGRGDLEGPRTRGGAEDVSAADRPGPPRPGDVVRGGKLADDARHGGKAEGVDFDDVAPPPSLLRRGPAPGVERDAAARLTRRDVADERLDERPRRSEPDRSARQPEGRDLTAGLADDDEAQARVQPAEDRYGPDEGDRTRGLSWLVHAARAFLGTSPAPERVESEPERARLLQPVPGEPWRLDERDAGPRQPRAARESPADASPRATSISERLQEEVDEAFLDRTTMSYYGILGLTKEPFSTSPDPAFFYESTSHKAVLYRLQIAIKLKRGLSLVLGDVGMGKTTLSRRLFQLLKREEKVCSHLILNPAYETEAEFLAALVKLFGITPPSNALPVVKSLELLEGYLFEKGVEEDRTVVLLIDEAQRLSSSSLELLRTLLNYETNEYKLLQLILMGQMELLPRIKEMKNLWDRISLKCAIDPLDQADTEAMIAFRLRTAGYAGRRNLFSAEAIQEIYRHSRGSPRRITTLCHDALERLVISEKHEVDPTIVRGLIKQVLA